MVLHWEQEVIVGFFRHRKTAKCPGEQEEEGLDGVGYGVWVLSDEAI